MSESKPLVFQKLGLIEENERNFVHPIEFAICYIGLTNDNTKTPSVINATHHFTALLFLFGDDKGFSLKFADRLRLFASFSDLTVRDKCELESQLTEDEGD